MAQIVIVNQERKTKVNTVAALGFSTTKEIQNPKSAGKVIATLLGGLGRSSEKSNNLGKAVPIKGGVKRKMAREVAERCFLFQCT